MFHAGTQQRLITPPVLAFNWTNGKDTVDTDRVRMARSVCLATGTAVWNDETCSSLVEIFEKSGKIIR